MSANDLSNVTKDIAEMKAKIAVIEASSSKWDSVLDKLHEVCISINGLVTSNDIQLKEYERVVKRQDKLENNHTSLKEEVIENRPLVKAVKALGLKIMWFALSVVGAATVIVISMKY